MSSLDGHRSCPASILVVDDKDQMREVLQKFLTAEGYKVGTAATAAEALLRLESRSYDLVLSDIRMPGMDGNELLDRLRARDTRTIVIMMTAFGSIEAAVSAIRRGAYDYISKPFEMSEIVMRIQRALGNRNLQQRVADLEKQVAAHGADRNIIGQSAVIKRLRQLIERIGPSDDTVLITGETGTGKELVARAIHQHSLRSSAPFVALDCSAIPESLIESELFGHEKGAFTGATEARPGLFESAARGTFFLDEVNSLSPAVQSKLLRVLQERGVRRVGGREDIPVQARIVAATNHDLAAAVKEGRFRRDLYYRLAVIPLALPPLRERRDDIPELILQMLERRTGERGGEPPRVTPEAMRMLISHDWPGNVRELENAISFATALGSTVVGVEDLPPSISGQSLERVASDDFTPATLEEVVRRHILRTLESVGGNQVKAAKILGIDRRTLYSKLRQWGARVTKAHENGTNSPRIGADANSRQ
jgi:DNA-binding NtrC family response regulator